MTTEIVHNTLLVSDEQSIQEFDCVLEHEDRLNHVDHGESNKRLNALYILKTKETNLLTQKCVDDIVDNATALVKNTV